MAQVIQFPSKLRPSVPTAAEAGAGMGPLFAPSPTAPTAPSAPLPPAVGVTAGGALPSVQFNGSVQDPFNVRVVDQRGRSWRPPGSPGLGTGFAVGATLGAAAGYALSRHETPMSDEQRRADPHGAVELGPSPDADHGLPE